ncbi:MAG: two-component sensor histidine kinase [Rhodocyclaceae bacterium]|nr:two-component sensor histidine kinase [Rhodocyclaceae bacterium]
MTPSLRRRLLVLLSGTVLLAWTATALFSYFDARHEIGEMLDAQLAQSAGLVAAQLEHEIEDETGGTVPRQYKQERKIAFQVWDRSDALLLRSASAPETRLSERDEGYADAVIDGKRWRIFSRRDESGRYVVQVGERYELRDELAESVAGHLMHPLAVALPVLALLIWFAVGAGLAPLGRLAAEVGRRAPDNLAPLEESRTPREVRPLLGALNTLFARLRALLEQERRFTADAAHELRTPLAAVKTQAQVALGAVDAEERARALAHVVTGTDRAAHLVEQLLMLARLDPQTALAQARPASLRDLAAECVAAQAPAAAQKNVGVGLAAEDDGLIAGDSTLLAVLLRNLVDNAVRYSPAGGEIEVSIGREDGTVVLRVTDNGPGIPEAERSRVFERFYRVLGSGEEGSGLGLSIVKRIADLHRASIALAAGPGGRGLKMSVAFPAVQA